ncbi:MULTISPECIES: hypothetical protein [unclassified Paenibacillus]|uniref:ABC transporter permease n=1 Tax=unclassified Paenibacillus TaxID=185978 RepID=UPI001AEA8398|nr:MULTISPECIES: hypothetical protein [unclassified Paenibacillus]MBP1154669.1 ABC-type transport system involved in multi-copper enzyme maturation permease subunit [Paenibacillus sp. PvP091]MBP1169947.1 ABC-type transport system involved in multi-copper enzyme maturation permease subunit [Paenibacillus sp. PvR098]MBP2440975.1 ABC-type transport system involved in multi-copper enzyme maturation permease subunit [Paenibacillus sp. PvP052]
MYRWLMQVRLEGKLVFGNRLLWPLPLLYGLWFVIVLAEPRPDVSQDIYVYAYDFHKLQHTLSLGLAMLLGMLMVRRDLKRSAYEWTGSLPLSSTALVFAKYVVGLMYLSLFTVCMSVVYMIFALRIGMEPASVWMEMSFFAMQYTCSYAVTLALAMALAVWIPNRISYMIGFCAWMFGTFFLDVFIISRLDLYFLKTFHLNQFLLESIWENPVWGPYISRSETAWSRLFVLSFTLLLLVVITWLLKRKRPSRTQNRWAVMSGLTFLLCIGFLWPYGQLWADRYKEWSVKEKLAVQYPGETTDKEQHDRVKVERYAIQVDRNEDDLLSVTAELRLQQDGIPNKDRIEFALNPGFTLQSVLWDGQEVNWTRKGGQVHIDALQPDQIDQRKGHTITFRYNGILFDWRQSKTRRETVVSFVEGSSVYLAEQAAWYPVPGDMREGYREVARNVFELSDQLGVEEESEFHLELNGFAGKVYGTIQSIPSGLTGKMSFQETARGVTLFGGHLTEIRVPGTETVLITAPSNRREAEVFLTKYAEIMNDYDSWIEHPIPGLSQIFYFPIRQVSTRNDNIKELMGSSLIIGESKHHNLDGFQLANAVHAALFSDQAMGLGFSTDPSDPQFSVVSEIRRAFYELYYHENKQDNQHSTLSPRFTVGSPNKKDSIGRMVERELNEGHAEHVKRVLNAFYRDGLTIEGQYEHRYPIIKEADWLRVWNGGGPE